MNYRKQAQLSAANQNIHQATLNNTNIDELQTRHRPIEVVTVPCAFNYLNA